MIYFLEYTIILDLVCIYNAFEIFIDGKKKFGAVLKIKDYSWAKNIGIVDTIKSSSFGKMSSKVVASATSSFCTSIFLLYFGPFAFNALHLRYML